MTMTLTLTWKQSSKNPVDFMIALVSAEILLEFSDFYVCVRCFFVCHNHGMDFCFLSVAAMNVGGRVLCYSLYL